MIFIQLVSSDLSTSGSFQQRSEEHTSELQSLAYLVCRLLLEKKNATSRNSLRGGLVRHTWRVCSSWRRRDATRHTCALVSAQHRGFGRPLSVFFFFLKNPPTPETHPFPPPAPFPT